MPELSANVPPLRCITIAGSVCLSEDYYCLRTHRLGYPSSRHEFSLQGDSRCQYRNEGQSVEFRVEGFPEQHEEIGVTSDAVIDHEADSREGGGERRIYGDSAKATDSIDRPNAADQPSLTPRACL